MNASLSSRRRYVPELPRETFGGEALGVAALVIGAILMVIAARTDSSLVAIPGFVSFAGSLMYWNLRLWHALYSRKK